MFKKAELIEAAVTIALRYKVCTIARRPKKLLYAYPDEERTKRNGLLLLLMLRLPSSNVLFKLML